VGRLQHNTGIDVGQPFSPEPDAGMPAALIGAEEEQRLVILLRSGGDGLWRHEGTLLRLASVPKADLSNKAGACHMRDCPQAMSALWALHGCIIAQEPEPKIPIPGSCSVRFNKREVRRMRQFLRNNGLSITLFALFLISFIGQALTGWRAHVEELHLHQLPEIGLIDYLTTGHFISATFENWESEFLQMAAYVLLTVFLFQKGSPESKRPDEPNPEDEPPHRRRGGRMHRHQSIGVVCC
jgi:hypothetical protein